VYTDSNGREMQQRLLNYRPTWKWNVTEAVAGNYYPVNALAFIKDQNQAQSQLTVLNDRSQAAASLGSGQLEFMIHRRILADDGRGVGEPLNETDGITPYPNPKRLGLGLNIVGKHYMLFDRPGNSPRLYRSLQSRVFSAPLLAFSQPSADPLTLKSAPMGRQAPDPLPSNVELMTCMVMPGAPAGTVLARLSHMFAVAEDHDMSQPVNVSLASIFPGRTLSDVQELSLTANQPRPSMQPIPSFHVQGEDQPRAPIKRSVSPPLGDDFIVTVNPMEIRTYSMRLA